MGVHEDEAVRPTIGAGQLRQGRENARVGFEGKPLDRHDLHEAPADTRRDTRPYLLTAHQGVDVDRVVGQLDRMIQPRYAELKPTKEVVVRDLAAFLGHRGMPLEPLHAKHTRQPALETPAFTLEVGDQRMRLVRLARDLAVVVEHHFHELALRHLRRKPGQRHHEVALVRGTEPGEQPASLLVHRGRERVGEVRARRIGIVLRRTTHRVDVQHPAVAQARQRLVDPHRRGLALLVRAAGRVVALEYPRRHECAVLAHDHAIVHHRRIVQEVGDGLAVRTVVIELRLRIKAADANQKEDDEDGDERRHPRDDPDHHRYCASSAGPLLRNGVERAA